MRGSLRVIEMQRRLLVDQPSLADLARRVQLLERLVADLQRRPAPVERPQQPAPLRQGNDDRKAEANRLDAAISRLLDGHPRADELTARQIREALAHDGFSPLPAERTVRLHLAEIRGNGNAGGVAADTLRPCPPAG